ncbi:CBS domain-containing protein [Actinoplanes sp. RD1]|uniref:CBS domain-containing protein n=1 Tax=Actinoplanes sp. RD1 TaxID=3064538 RepID=UPI0027411D4E|nr:CBS domain-containing protein [Actinoplanes sp. RD1]
MALPDTGAGNPRGRLVLGYGVVGAGIAGVVVISVVVIWLAAETDRPEAAQLVFTAALPLLGTWVGTVLAFYFAGDNLLTATQSTINTLRLAGELAPDTPVTEVMIGVGRIRPKELVAGEAKAGELVLKTLYAAMRNEHHGRLPVFDTGTGAALYVVHEPDIDKYAQGRGTKAESLSARDTLAALVSAGPELAAAVRNFVAVPASATVARARDELRGKPQSKDVFVTEGGGEGDRVLGWLTHSDLARVS